MQNPWRGGWCSCARVGHIRIAILVLSWRVAAIAIQVAPLGGLEELGIPAAFDGTTEISFETQYCGPSLG